MTLSLKKATNFNLMFVILLLMFLLFNTQSVMAENSDTVPIEIDFWIKISNFDLSNKMVDYELTAFVYGIPDNKSDVSIGVDGYSILCKPQKMENGWRYYGKSELHSMKTSGAGEFFPFDQYTQEIHVFLYVDVFNFLKEVDYVYDLSIGNYSAYFVGSEAENLNDNWKTNENHGLPVRTTEDSILIDFARNDDKTVLNFLEFIVPIIACYFLMGASLILNPRNLSERLRIYVALFLFCPSFLFTIQEYLPYHTSFTFPEFLLVSLIISTAILGIFSTISKVRQPKEKSNALPETTIGQRKWDFWGLIVAFLLFLILYFSVFFSEFNYFVQHSQINYEFICIGLLSYFVIPSFFFWIPIVFPRITWQKKYVKTIGVFSIYLLITLLVYLLVVGLLPLLSIVLFQLYPVIALFFGGFIRIHQRTNIKSAIITVLSGILGTLYAGILFYFISIFIPKIYFYQITLISGGLGLTFGLFALLGALCTSLLILLKSEINKNVFFLKIKNLF